MASSANPVLHRIQRRAFLRNVVLACGGLPLLAACGASPAQQAAPTTAPKPAETAKPAAPIATAAPAPAATAQPTQAPAKPAAAVTVKYLSHIWAEKGRAEAWRALVNKFHSQQNDIRIEEVSFPYSEFFQRVMTQLAGGRLDADVLTCADELAVRLVKGNHLEPVDDLVAKMGIKDKLDKGVHDFVTSGGKLYGILSVLGPYALIYNKELYEKEGIKKPPATPEEYFAVAKQVTKRPNQFGHAGRSTLPEQNGWWQDLTQWVLGYDGMWAKAKKPLVTEAPVINAVKAYKKLYDEAIPQGATASDYRRMAWEGKIVQYIDNNANIGILKAGSETVYPKIFTAPPPWPNRKSIAMPVYLGVYAGSANKQAAKTWLEWVYKKENIQALQEQTLDIIPPYAGALSETWLKTFHWVEGFQAAKGVVFASTVDGLEANIAEFRQIVLQKVSEVLTAGKAVEPAMAEAQKELEALVARIG